MILSHGDYVERFEAGGPFDADMAQTVASWWYSPGAPALVALTTAGKVIPGLADEVERELTTATHANWADKADLNRLLVWAKEQENDLGTD